jgi:hypothetical protein
MFFLGGRAVERRKNNWPANLEICSGKAQPVIDRETGELVEHPEKGLKWKISGVAQARVRRTTKKVSYSLWF